MQTLLKIFVFRKETDVVRAWSGKVTSKANPGQERKILEKFG